MPSRSIFVGNAVYCVSNSSFSDLKLWREKADFERFLRTADAYLRECPFLSLLAYVVLPNEYVFLLKNEENGFWISEFVRRLQIAYAMYFQKKYPWCGESIFSQRFGAERVLDQDFVYGNFAQKIHLAPVYKNIVSHIAQWPYTSAHQVANTGYISTGETHLSLKVKISPQVKESILDRARQAFIDF